MRPDYEGGGIVNLMSSLRHVFGAPDSQYVPFNPVDLHHQLQGRSVILLVVDGLGYHQLRDRDAAPALNHHLVCSLTSVFPSTTASAITTYLTGVAPHQHGLVGWHTYFKAIDTIFTPLPFVPRDPDVPLPSDLTPASLFDHKPLFDLVRAPTHSVSPESIAFSPFNRFHCGPAEIHPYTTVAQLFEALSKICRHTQPPSLTYAYYPTLDFLSHMHGSMSEEVSRDLALFNRTFERFLTTVTDTNTTVLVTADHGFIDPTPGQCIDLAEHPEIEQLLARPLGGEPRVAYCYVKPGKQEQFDSLVTNRLGEAMTLYPSEQLVRENYFGLGEPHPELCERVGDFTLVMKTEHMLKDWLPGEKRINFRGVHGGVSENEMLVPLCIAEV